MLVEEATHESEEEPDAVAEDAEKRPSTFEGKKARKKQERRSGQ